MSIGSTIKDLRHKKDVTQEELAEYLGVTSRAVSQWECERTVPDVYMLPTIASFFDISIDYLFHSDKDEYEKEISFYESKYYEFWNHNEKAALFEIMKEAVSKYPTEYRLLARYLNVIDWCSENPAFALEMKKDAISVYERIVSHCTIDSIRIWAKKIMINYYKKLTQIENSEITISEAEKILGEMPLMQNSRDYLSCFLYQGEERHQATQKTIAEMSCLMTTAIFNNYLYNPIYTLDEKIDALESILKINQILYKNENYGKNAANVARIMMRLGCFYYENSEKEKAVSLLRQSLALAKKIDETNKNFVCKDGLLKGYSIEKEKIWNLNATSLVKELESFICFHKKIDLSEI